MTKQTLVIEISPKTIWRIIFTVIGLMVVVKLRSLIFYLLFALLFSVALAPLIGWLQFKGLKRSSALALALSIVVGAVFGLFGVVAVSLVDTVSSFASDLPQYLENLRQYDVLEAHVDGIIESVKSVDMSAVVRNGLSSGSSLLSGASKVFEAVLFTFFFTVYMLLEKDYIKRVLKSIIPASWNKRTRDIEEEFIDVVGGYIRGQLFTSFLTGLVSYIIFRAFGLPNALALGIIAGLTDVIPVVGGLIGLIPATLVAITVSPLTAVACVVLVQAYSTFGNYFINPRIYGKALDMSPFLVTLSTMTGLLLFGIPGIILALPAAAMIGYILTEYYGIPLIEDDD